MGHFRYKWPFENYPQNKALTMQLLCSNALLSSQVSVSYLEAEVRKTLLHTGWFTAGNLLLPGTPQNLYNHSHRTGDSPGTHAPYIGIQFQSDIHLKMPPQSILSTFLLPPTVPGTGQNDWGWGGEVNKYIWFALLIDFCPITLIPHIPPRNLSLHYLESKLIWV